VILSSGSAIFCTLLGKPAAAGVSFVFSKNDSPYQLATYPPRARTSSAAEASQEPHAREARFSPFPLRLCVKLPLLFG